MYSTTWCGYCAKTRTYLRRNGIPFEDRDVELTDSGNKEYNALGGGGVPILLVHDKVIRGYKPDAIDEALAKSSKAPQ
jgi:glutaredoxin